MTAGDPNLVALSDPWARAVLAMKLFAVNPFRLGGIRVRSGPSAVRDRLVSGLRELWPAAAPIVRVPIDITSDRLLGGLSLGATLHEGRPVFEEGVLRRADQGVLVLAMAERADSFVISQVCAVIDRGELCVERDGFAARVECSVGVLALDEGIDEERAPLALTDRLAFDVDLDEVDPRQVALEDADGSSIERARQLLDAVVVDAAIVEALVQGAMALGVASVRAVILTTEAARAHAALRGRTRVDEADTAAAAALVLAPRATRMPVPPAREDEEKPASDELDAEAEEPAPPEAETGEDGPSDTQSPGELGEVLLEAVRSVLPSGLLDGISVGKSTRQSSRGRGRSGAISASKGVGRPAGSRAGTPEGGARLHLIATLTAAAPWQRIRRDGSEPRSLHRPRVQIRKSDLRTIRHQHRRETLVVFSVDASGSAAAHRLAEAKGAVERILTECYSRRDHVALVAFRGSDAPVVLPPTRSLARARRSLAGLVGGGPTPIAAGIDSAVVLALQARKSGKTPIVVLMTDARANVARNGSRGGALATADAIASARAARAQGVVSLLLDTSPRPREEARKLASEMGASYMPLPHADADSISRRISSLGKGAS